MDFESLLLRLGPLLADSHIDEVINDQNSAEGWLSALDDLAVHLRAPTNRDIVGQSGVLSKLITRTTQTLGILNGDQTQVIAIQVGSQLIRCISNCLADNDANRALFYTEVTGTASPLISQLPQVLQIAEDGDHGDKVSALKFVTLALTKNLCLDNESYTETCSKLFTKPLLDYLTEKGTSSLKEDDLDGILMAADLVLEFVKYTFSSITTSQLQLLATIMKNAAFLIKSSPAPEGQISNIADDNEEEDTDTSDDGCGELVQVLTETLELVLSKNERIDLSSSQTVHKIQESLLQTLSFLEQRENLENKLIIMRRLLYIMGLISANVSNSNLQDRELCYSVLSENKGGYTTAAVLIVLANSISSRETADQVYSTVNAGQIIKACRGFKDPMQFQGLFDLLKKLINLTNITDLSEEDFSILFSQLKLCHDQTQIYQDIAPLLDTLLGKITAVCSSSSLRKHFKNTNFKTVILERGGIPACIIIDKLVVQMANIENGVLSELWDAAFHFKDSSNVSTPFLFQLMKSLGIYLHSLNVQDNNIVFDSHSSQLVTLFETIAPLKANTDSASKSIHNNAKYVAGITLKLLQNKDLTPQEANLMAKATQILRDDDNI